MVARLLPPAVFALLLISPPVSAAPVVCLAQGGVCQSNLLVEASLPESFTLELFVASGASGFESFLLDELRWDPSILSLESVVAGPEVDAFGFFDDLGVLSMAFGLLTPSFGDGGILTSLVFSANNVGTTAIAFQLLPDTADFDADGNFSEPNPFGPILFQDADADPDVPPFGFSGSERASGTDVTVRSVATVVPEPATLSLLGLGLASAAARRWQKGGPSTRA